MDVAHEIQGVLVRKLKYCHLLIGKLGIIAHMVIVVVVCFIVYYLLSFIHLHRASPYDLPSILLITSLYSPDVWSHDSIAPFIIFT